MSVESAKNRHCFPTRVGQAIDIDIADEHRSARQLRGLIPVEMW